nr:putative serine/threonine-protein kinase hsl1 [Quercus suber]
MEYVDGGELFHHVDERKGLPEDETVYIFRQIVSALLYCHRMLICHRDLKPENILLNQADLTVKLIDFGMAALQPEGRLLSTPCGSPHYAAPEVVSSKPYDGTRADVWSCGVILYVMLTGTTPYNYSPDGDIRTLFRDIARAHYWMPTDLSLDAQDLIKRIFVADPKHRITMDEMWEHALLHKYDEQFGYEGKAGSKEAAIGTTPTVEDWTVKRIQDIDREILRNMRTLWHSEPEQSLIQKLINSEMNQEKLFYGALVKHREENQENYVGNLDDMDYSASDYHHNPPVQLANAPPLPTAPRSQSQYSILNDEHLKVSHSFAEPPSSVSSYDPYRASRDPFVNSRNKSANVTVHRDGSANARRSSNLRPLRHIGAHRPGEIPSTSRRTANLSTSSLARSGRSRMSMQRSSVSRGSLTSSAWASSPPVIAHLKASHLHKRGVSFNHMRRTSTRSALTFQSSAQNSISNIPDLPHRVKTKPLKSSDHSTKRAPEVSPAFQATRMIRSRKERAQTPNTPLIKTKRPDTGSQHLRSEIRKHSAELEKACQEAFFRSPHGSNRPEHTPVKRIAAGPSTPSQSTATRTPKPSSTGRPSISRPLPQVPNETPTTYLTKTLEETRNKLAAYKSSGEDNTAKFDEVMRMLENILPGSQVSPSREIRSFTAPEAKTPDHLGFLPIIAEEGDHLLKKDESLKNWHRSVTAPVQKTDKAGHKTVRIVPPRSPAVPPLRINKHCSGGPTDDANRIGTNLSNEEGESPGIGGLLDENTAIEQKAKPSEGKHNDVRKKKSVWFGLTKKDINSSTNTAAGANSNETTADHSYRGSKLPSSSSQQDEPAKKKKSLVKWFGRFGDKSEQDAVENEEPRPQSRAGRMTEQRPSNPAFGNRSLDSFFSSASPSPSSNDDPPVIGTERSWFARFFHVNPAVQSLCFSIPRGRARQELVLLLREWQHHGIRDLEYSRESNTIVARVDKNNSLDIKPVTFQIHLFVVLEHGRRAGLSIARFQQVKGAASGFRHVLEVVDGVMRGRGWLVQDQEKWKAMCDVVHG